MALRKERTLSKSQSEFEQLSLVNGRYGKRSSVLVCAQSMRMMRVLCLNHRDELDRSTLDLDSRQKRQTNVSVTETNSIAQYRSVRSMRTCIACMNSVPRSRGFSLDLGNFDMIFRDQGRIFLKVINLGNFPLYTLANYS